VCKERDKRSVTGRFPLLQSRLEKLVFKEKVSRFLCLLGFFRF